MSYQRFLSELEAQIVERRKSGLPSLGNDEYLYAARDVWLGQRRLSELVSFTLQNWDSGNGDEFMRPLIDALVDARRVRLLKVLLTPSSSSAGNGSPHTWKRDCRGATSTPSM